MTTAFENEFEEDKFEILFEKIFVRFIVKELRGKLNEKIIQESNEDTKNVASLLTDLLNYSNDDQVSLNLYE